MFQASNTRAKLFGGLAHPGLIATAGSFSAVDEDVGGFTASRAVGGAVAQSEIARGALRRYLASCRRRFVAVVEFIDTYSLLEGATLFVSALFAAVFIAAGFGLAF